MAYSWAKEASCSQDWADRHEEVLVDMERACADVAIACMAVALELE